MQCWARSLDEATYQAPDREEILDWLQPFVGQVHDLKAS